jgi:hypothetical protein
MKTYMEWNYSATIIDLGARQRCVQLHARADLPSGKESLVLTGQEVVYTPEPVWTA